MVRIVCQPQQYIYRKYSSINVKLCPLTTLRCIPAHSFHFLFCHGFEERGAKRAGVLASGLLTASSMILHMARMAANLAEHVTIYCHGNEELTAKFEKDLETKDVTVEPRKVTAVEKSGDGLRVYFEDGGFAEERFLANAPSIRLNGSFHEQLGLGVEPIGFIKAEPPFNETAIPGVFVAGDCGTMLKAVPQAIAMGSLAAGGLVAQLASAGRF